jgi:hypothetical protein
MLSRALHPQMVLKLWLCRVSQIRTYVGHTFLVDKTDLPKTLSYGNFCWFLFSDFVQDEHSSLRFQRFNPQLTMTITVPSFHFWVLVTTWERHLGTLWSALTWFKQRKRGWHCNFSWNSEWPIRSVSGVLHLLDDNEVFTSAMEKVQSSLEVYRWIVLHRCGFCDAIGLW